MLCLTIKTLSRVAMLIESLTNTSNIFIRLDKDLNGFIECEEFLTHSN